MSVTASFIKVSVCLSNLFAADERNFVVAVLLLKKLFPDKINDAVIAEAANHTLSRYRGAHSLKIMIDLGKQLEELKAQNEARRAKAEEERLVGERRIAEQREKQHVMDRQSGITYPDRDRSR